MRGFWHRSVSFVIAWLFLVPGTARSLGSGHPCGPGRGLLDSLYLLPPALRLLLRTTPSSSSMARWPPTSPSPRNTCRRAGTATTGRWGRRSCETPPTSPPGGGYGYLAHLAADTLAHNTFVPRKLFLTRTGKPHGHTYWEHRMDLHVGEEYLGKARRLVMNYDHGDADELFDTVLSRTLFSFRTNRRIFRGMIQAQDNDRWKQVFDRVLRELPLRPPAGAGEDVHGLSPSISSWSTSGPATSPGPGLWIPVGALNLRIAKKLRRAGKAEGGARTPRSWTSWRTVLSPSHWASALLAEGKGQQEGIAEERELRRTSTCPG